MKPQPGKINQEACEWIAKLHGASPSSKDLMDLREWMQQSPAHKVEIQAMAKLWGELNILTELAVPVEVPRLRKVSRNSFLSYLFGHRTAFSVFATTAALLLIVLVWRPLDYPGIETPSSFYSTLIGEQQLVTLSDSSTVLLNTNSKLRVDYTSEFRNIYLSQGEAHFDVQSNPELPFRVFAGSGVVNAVGTAFSVRLEANFVDVTVVEGSVQISPVQNVVNIGTPLEVETEDPNIIKAGQTAIYDQAIESIELIETINQSEIDRKLAWQDGVLQFSGDPLGEVVEEVSRYTPISIVITDPKLRDLRIGGLFKVGETEKMFDVLERSFGLKVEHIDQNIVHLSLVEKQSKS